MRLSYLDILEQCFHDKFRGYNKQEVDTFLHLVADDFKSMTEEIKEKEKLISEKDEEIILELLTDIVTTSGEQQLKSFDIYVVSTNGTFKIEGCVITQGEVQFGKTSPLLLVVQGEGKKLSRVGDENFSLPGNLQSASSTRTPTKPLLEVLVSNSAVSNLVAATLLVQNNIQWTPYETLQNSLSVTNATNAMYPSAVSYTHLTLPTNREV